MNKQTCYKK